MQIKFEDDLDLYCARSDGVYYVLAPHKSAHLLLFGVFTENMTEAQFTGHRIWVDANGKGRYQPMDESLMTKLVPAEFVRAKYTQAIYFFNSLEDTRNKVQSKKAVADEEALEINSSLVRLVKSMIRDIMNSEHIAETIKNEIDLIIQNVVENKKYLPEYIKRSDTTKNNNGWSSLIITSDNYCFNEAELRRDDDNILYYFAVHKTDNHLIFARDRSSKFESAAIHQLYINRDSGLGKFKVQTEAGEISNHFYVPVDYIIDRCNRFRKYIDDFEKLQNTADVYSRQTLWHILQDNIIHGTNYIQRELESDLRQRIDKSLEHDIVSTYNRPDINTFDGFYDKVVEIEKKMRLEARECTYPIRLMLFSLHNRNVSMIHLNYDNIHDVFVLDEKVRILISKYDPDYYVVVSEAWAPKNKEHVDYRRGDIAKLPSHEKTEMLTFIGKFKNSIDHRSDRSEIYEIIREKPSDEESRILELRKFDGGKLDFTMEYQASIEE